MKKVDPNNSLYLGYIENSVTHLGIYKEILGKYMEGCSSLIIECRDFKILPLAASEKVK